jgi:hypothetical protein
MEADKIDPSVSSTPTPETKEATPAGTTDPAVSPEQRPARLYEPDPPRPDVVHMTDTPEKDPNVVHMD